jgi:hypothetical protein
MKTNDQSQQRQILNNARNQQLSVLKNEGITADQYENVLIALNSDPSLRAKFDSYLGSSSGS